MKPPPPPPQFATNIPGRSPEFKHHNNIGHAKLAVSQTIYNWTKVRGGTIYKWDPENNEWKLVVDIQAGSHPNDLPWRVDKRWSVD